MQDLDSRWTKRRYNCARLLQPDEGIRPGKGTAGADTAAFRLLRLLGPPQSSKPQRLLAATEPEAPPSGANRTNIRRGAQPGWRGLKFRGARGMLPTFRGALIPRSPRNSRFLRRHAPLRQPRTAPFRGETVCTDPSPVLGVLCRCRRSISTGGDAG